MDKSLFFWGGEGTKRHQIMEFFGQKLRWSEKQWTRYTCSCHQLSHVSGEVTKILKDLITFTLHIYVFPLTFPRCEHCIRERERQIFRFIMWAVLHLVGKCTIWWDMGSLHPCAECHHQLFIQKRVVTHTKESHKKGTCRWKFSHFTTNVTKETTLIEGGVSTERGKSHFGTPKEDVEEGEKDKIRKWLATLA